MSALLVAVFVIYNDILIIIDFIRLAIDFIYNDHQHRL